MLLWISFEECDQFFNTLSTEQELTHGSNVDRINPYIEECIFTKKPLTQVLRLLCLQSICNNGLKPKVYEYYKKEIIQVKSVTIIKSDICVM